MMKQNLIGLLVISILQGALCFAAPSLPKDGDEILYIPQGTKFINQRDILVPAGITRVFFQNGLATVDADAINGNARYCFMLLKTPSARDRVLEKDTVIVTNGTYRSSTSVIELEVGQPSSIYDLGCLNGPKEFDKKPTIAQFRKEIEGVFEMVMPGPDPIK
jgi:hypothetical protein